MNEKELSKTLNKLSWKLAHMMVEIEYGQPLPRSGWKKYENESDYCAVILTALEGLFGLSPSIPSQDIPSLELRKSSPSNGGTNTQ